MSITAAKLQVDVTADTASAERNLNHLGGTVGKTPKVFGLAKMAAVGLGLGFAAAATGAVTMGIKTASNLQQADIAFTTMLGSGAKAKSFLDDLQKFAASTPFEFPDLVSASQRLLAMGFTAKDVVPTMTAIGDAVAGLGGGKEQIMQVTTALGQMQAKGKIQSDELLQLTEAGIPALKILADTYGVTTGQMQDMVTKGKVLSDKAIPALVKGLEHGTKSSTAFGGMMEKQSHTMAGAWSTLMDTFNMGMANVLKPLIPLISSALPAVTGALSGAFTGFSSSLGVVVGWIATLATSLPGLWAMLTGGLGGVGAAGTGLGNTLGAVRDGFNEMATNVQGIVKPAMDALSATWKGTIQPALSGLEAAVNLMLPALVTLGTVIANVATYLGGALAAGLQVVLPVLIAIGGILLSVVIGAFNALFTTVGRVATALSIAAGYIGDHSKAFTIAAGVITAVFLPALANMAIQATISAAKVVAGWVAQGIAAVVSGAETAAIWVMLTASSIAGAAGQGVSMVKVIAGWVASAIAAVASGAETVAIWAMLTASSIAGAASQGLQVVKVVAGWVLMGVQSLLGAAKMAAAWLIAMGPIGLVIAAVIAIVALIVLNWDTITAATSKAWAATVGFVTGAWASMKAFVGKAVAAVVGFVKSHWLLLVAIIGGPLALAVGLVIKHWGAIKAFVSGAVAAVKSAVSGAFNSVKSAVSSAMSAVSSAVSGAWAKVKTAFSTGASAALAIVKSLPGKILGALGNVGTMLYNAGASIIRGLAQGISNGLGAVKGAISGVLSAARNLLPFSPAKEGPFSGKGWTLHSGRSISAALARGITDNAYQVKDAALFMAQSAVPPLTHTKIPGLTFGGTQQAGGAITKARTAGLGGVGGGQAPGRSVSIVMHAYNPVAEAQSVTTNKTLQRVAALGLTG